MLAGIIAVIHAIVSLALVFLILLHSGKGGGMSDVFGGGGMASGLGGSTVVERNLDRITVVVSILFTITTLLLVWQWG